VCYLIFYHALSHISASRVSAFAYLQPLIATVIAVPTLGEYPSGALLAGGILVLSGVCMAERL
jgi:drug/metabolite transporter (DMT)-like permease